MAQLKTKAKSADHRYNDVTALAFFNKVCAVLAKVDLKWVESHSEVKAQTMRKWLSGDTYLPQSRTLFSVADAIGFKITYTQRKGYKIPKRLCVVK